MTNGLMASTPVRCCFVQGWSLAESGFGQRALSGSGRTFSRLTEVRRNRSDGPARNVHIERAEWRMTDGGHGCAMVVHAVMVPGCGICGGRQTCCRCGENRCDGESRQKERAHGFLLSFEFLRFQGALGAVTGLNAKVGRVF